MKMFQFEQTFISQPLFALFLTISLGYLVGKFRFKSFQLGGIAGSLIVGVCIGQLGIKISTEVSSIFFMLFIYAVGYQGGPLFFRSLNLKTLNQLLSATLTCFLGLLAVVIMTRFYGFDKGIAAGLAAGSLTQSSIIGAASEIIHRLPLPEVEIQQLQSNIAVGFAVCYLFGVLGPILLLTAVIPGIKKWNLREEAMDLAQSHHSQSHHLEAGQSHAVSTVITRYYQIQPGKPVVGLTVGVIFDKYHHLAIESLLRNQIEMEVDAETVIIENDIVSVTGEIHELLSEASIFGTEICYPKSIDVEEETRYIVMSNSEFDGKTLRECYEETSRDEHYGLIVRFINRLGERLAVDDEFILQQGDEIELTGRTKDLNKIASRLGYTLSALPITDFIIFGLGLALGSIVGTWNFYFLGSHFALGTGGGCLLSGLMFGWLSSRYPRFGALPVGASNFLRDFGLAVFVATIGITAGPQAVTAIRAHGLELFFAGVFVTLIPQIISVYCTYYLLRIQNPIELLAAIAGGRSANPAFAALLDKAGNSTPVFTFTVTYAMANVWMALLAPVLINYI